MRRSIAVIIPARDEEELIGAALASVDEAAAYWAQAVAPGSASETPEVVSVVVDGGSSDRTRELAAGAGATVLEVAPGRSSQMNAGAAAVTADVLVFLHADCRLPADGLAEIDAALDLAPREAAWGRFDVRLEPPSPLLRLVAGAMNLRSRLTGIATGDQAIFVSAIAWELIGGFAAQPLMEDIEICRRLKLAVGQPLCLRALVTSSSRRWQEHGALRTVASMWLYRALYALGVSPESLHRRYYGVSESVPGQESGLGGPPAPENAEQDPRERVVTVPERRALIVFAREPIAGQVKMRLAAEIGELPALRVYRQLLTRTLRLAQRYRQRGSVAVILAGAGFDGAGELEGRASRLGFGWQEQCGGDLGARMHDAFERAFAEGFEEVVLIGCDCPVMGVRELDSAFAALAASDAAINPAEDGGYALVALRRPLGALFEGISWGSDAVLAQTRQAALQAGVKLELLRQLWDVDRVADLRRWQAGSRAQR